MNMEGRALLLAQPREKEDDELDDDEKERDELTQWRKEPIALDSPPIAPTGEWVRRHPYEQLANLAKMFGPDHFRPLTIKPFSSLNRTGVDLNEFQWEQRLKHPAKECELRCWQWRHGGQEQSFEMQVWAAHEDLAAGSGSISAVFKAEVSAINLSDSRSGTIPVQFDLVAGDTMAIASSLVEDIDKDSGLSPYEGMHSRHTH